MSHPFIHLFVYQSICPSIHLFTDSVVLHLFIHPSICSPTHLSIIPFFHLSNFPLIHLSTHPFVHPTMVHLPIWPSSNCPFFFLSTHPFLHSSICPSNHLSIILYPFIHPLLCPSIHMSICLPIQFSTYPFVHLCICLFTHLSTHPFVHPSIYQSCTKNNTPWCLYLLSFDPVIFKCFKYKTINGNSDSRTAVKRILLHSVSGRYIRFIPEEFLGARCLRVEIFGSRVGKEKSFFTLRRDNW